MPPKTLFPRGWLRPRPTVDELLLHLPADDDRAQRGPAAPETLRPQGRRLAEVQTLADRAGRDRLRPRLRQNAQVIEEVQRRLTTHASQHPLPPAALWLVENGYLLGEQIREACRDLVQGRRRKLPQLARGPEAGLPRVYALVLELVGRVDGRIDTATLDSFVEGYQELSHLRLPELWAVPGMLRLALIENVRRVALCIAREFPPSQAPDSEHSPRLAAHQISIANTINSLRGLGEIDWKEFVERHSAMEQILRGDPAGIYRRMNFDSRDAYRHAVEVLAAHSGRDEEAVASAAVACAQRGQPPQSHAHDPVAVTRVRHVGYYLVDRGRALLEQDTGYRRGPAERIGRIAKRHPLAWYLGATLAAGGGLALSATWIASRIVGASLWELALVLLVLLPLAIQCGIAIVHRVIAHVAHPRPILRLDFSRGIPEVNRTLVAIPTLLTSRRAVTSLLEQLEIAYLANRDRNLAFALLTDFPDADRALLPADSELLEMARAGVERLNRHYCDYHPCAFYLLHRSRTWNPREGVWMGTERKRGKLVALNRLLRDRSTEDFSLVEGNLDRLGRVRYVITLDTDTRLPADAGRQLVGCMAHPLNRPLLHPHSRRVVEGYAILQPRVATPIPDAQRSRFSRLFAGEAGVDPYTTQTSDLYQDLFGEGSFIGKGIYDLDAFEAALQDRFPDDRLLSHDLIEGCYARSGLASDVLLFEGTPTRLLSDMSRRHRWIRGDWQIAAWLLPSVPTARTRESNPLSGLSRWKIFDNLRRSVTPVFLLAFLVLGWGLGKGLAVFATVLALASVAVPILLSAAVDLARKPKDTPWRLHLGNQLAAVWRSLAREAIGLAVLPYAAHVHLDAICRTLYRLHVSRRGLLQWTTAAQAESLSRLGCRAHYEIMWACPVAALGLAAWLTSDPLALLAAGPLLAAWLAGPLLAWAISQPIPAESPHLEESQIRNLRRWTRLTWHYFDVHVSRRHHGLPPDNVLLSDEWAAVSRTSPTNIGLGLLADLAALDLGYLSASRWVARAGRTLDTLEGLERYRGHFYNWYDTRTLQPAPPLYVSTVDSGNLWASLVVLRVGLQQLAQRPLVPPRLWEGLHDTLSAIEGLGRHGSGLRRGDLDHHLGALDRIVARGHGAGAGESVRLLGQVRSAAKRLLAVVPRENLGLRQWIHALVRQASSTRTHLAHLAFWGGVHAILDPSVVLDDQAMPAARRLRTRLEELDRRCLLSEVPRAVAEVQALIDALLPAIRRQQASPAHEAMAEELEGLRRRAEAARGRAADVMDKAARLVVLCGQLSTMDFRFLFRPEKKLLAIGYNVAEQRGDSSCYDLLASESRLTSYLAVSHGQLPQEHWFRLGRLMATRRGRPVLLSWSGSIFEYLMPMLLMPSYSGTLLDAGCRAAVGRQIHYGASQGIPWGVSESCCHEIDVGGAYRYRAFGVPGLGLARGLAQDAVVAPYASAMAAMIAPREACNNLETLERHGALSVYGFFDAADFTPRRCAEQGKPSLCRTVMAHHSGMALLALTRVLLGDLFPRRFLDDPVCRSYELLLQERIPQNIRPVDPASLDLGPESGKRAPRPAGLPEPVPEPEMISAAQ